MIKEINAIFQNDNFIVVEKPALVLSVSGRFESDERPVLGKILEKELGKKIFPVHRLDYEASGLIIFAKNKDAHRAANTWFEKKEITKSYEVLTEGTDEKLKVGQELEWHSNLVRGKKRTFEAEYGAPSETRALFVGTDTKDSVSFLRWRIKPITGRAHQIRFELSKRGYFVLGDVLYGSKVAYWEPGIALRAVEFDLKNVKEKLGLPDKIKITDKANPV